MEQTTRYSSKRPDTKFYTEIQCIFDIFKEYLKLLNRLYDILMVTYGDFPAQDLQVLFARLFTFYFQTALSLNTTICIVRSYGTMGTVVLCILILLPSMLAAIYLTLPGIEILKKQPPWLHDPWIQCKERATERHHHNYEPYV
jgi:hypothetical protein